MFKRVTIVALVVAAFLVLAVPAMAWNGYRGDYTTTEACQTCHSGIAGIPPVYNTWVDSKHANSGGRANRLPYGSSCGGCHSSNFDPSKIVPTPTATNATTGAVSWTGANASASPTTQTSGNAATSEAFVGCSSCHYGANVAGGLEIYGVDTNDTAHAAPYGLMANAEICGQCHSRYAYTVDTYSVAPVPYMAVSTPVATGTQIPNPSPTSLLQPQYAIGYPMVGTPAPTAGWGAVAPLSAYLNIPAPGWSPTPDPAATSAAGLQTYWKDAEGNDLPWQQKGHDGSAAQYPEWANEGHAMALATLTSLPFWASFPEATKQQCLECHSADFRISKEAGKPVTSADVQYGVTCVGCHTPHDAGTAKGVWDEEFDAQLVGDPKNPSDVCIECHNAELPVGTEATPGTEVHHPMKEMMAGYGAIGVDEIPSVHEGSCVQCHMPPTSYSGTSPQLGGNHTFQIIDPEVAAEVSPLPTSSATPSYSGKMPFSACSTCHGGNAPNDPMATYLQPRIDQRQSWTKAKIALIWDELDKAAVRLGYADTDAAHTALVAIPESDWTMSQRLFLSSFTNVEFVDSEGSYGLHNWAYSVRIVNKAQQQAMAVSAAPAPEPRKWIVSLRVSRTEIKKGQKIYFRGAIQDGWGIAASGKMTLQRRMAGQSWRNYKSQTLTTSGTYSIVQRLNFTKGKWYFRVSMPGDGGLNLAAVSPNRVIRIK